HGVHVEVAADDDRQRRLVGPGTDGFLVEGIVHLAGRRLPLRVVLLVEVLLVEVRALLFDLLRRENLARRPTEGRVARSIIDPRGAAIPKLAGADAGPLGDSNPPTPAIAMRQGGSKGQVEDSATDVARFVDHAAVVLDALGPVRLIEADHAQPTAEDRPD